MMWHPPYQYVREYPSTEEKKTDPDMQTDVIEFANVQYAEIEEEQEAHTSEPDSEGVGEESIDRYGENWEDSDEERDESEERWFGLGLTGLDQLRIARRLHSPYVRSYDFFRKRAQRESQEAGTT